MAIGFEYILLDYLFRTFVAFPNMDCLLASVVQGRLTVWEGSQVQLQCGEVWLRVTNEHGAAKSIAPGILRAPSAGASFYIDDDISPKAGHPP